MNYRCVITFVLSCLWAASPALACIPNASMSPAEMECCKKMAGNCDMGGTNHKCCDTTVSHAAPSTAIVHTAVSHGLVMMAVDRSDLPKVEERTGAAFPLATQSPSPPRSVSVLRI